MRQLVDEPRLRDRLNVVADQRDKLAAKEEFEVSMLERMQSGRELAFKFRFRPFDLLRAQVTRSFLLELQPNSGTHHCVAGEVYLRIVVQLPKPFRTIIISADAGRVNKLTGILMSRLKNAIEGDAVIGVQLMSPNHVGVLLLSM